MKLNPLIGKTPWHAQTVAMRAATSAAALGLMLGAIAVACQAVCLLVFPGAPTHPVGHSTYPIALKDHLVFVTHSVELAYRSAWPLFEIGAVFLALAMIVYDRIESRSTGNVRLRLPGMRAFWRRPLAERVALVLVGLTPVYLVVSLGFSIYCVPTLTAGYDGGICTVGRSFGFLDRFIPAIWRGVDVFTGAGNLSTANVVGAVTEFIWGSALCVMAIIVVLSCAWALSLSAPEKAQLRSVAEEKARRGPLQREKAQRGRQAGLILFFAMAALAFYGNFDYRDIGHSARNIYVQPVDFLFLIVQLSFVMFLVAIFTTNWTRSLVLRSMKG